MQRLLETFSLLIAVTGAEAWFLQGYFAGKPEWEPALAFVSAFGVLLGRDPVRSAINRPRSEHDRALFDQFLQSFPSNGASARFLRDHDLGAPFRSSDLTQLDDFAETWNNAEHKFHSKELEKLRVALLKATEEFRSKLAVSVSGTGGPEFLSMGLRDWEDRPEVLAKRDELNALGSAVYKAHQALVESGNRILRKDA